MHFARSLLLVVALAALGCSSKSTASGPGAGGTTGTGGATGSSRFERCKQLYAAVCGTLLRCKVYKNASNPGAGVVDSNFCATTEAGFLSNCTTDAAYQGTESASDAQVQSCIQGFNQYACTELCGKVAPDPPACAALNSEPNKTLFQCAP